VFPLDDAGRTRFNIVKLENITIENIQNSFFFFTPLYIDAVYEYHQFFVSNVVIRNTVGCVSMRIRAKYFDVKNVTIENGGVYSSNTRGIV